ncbi:flagellar biosynthesis repressor FlbT [Stappia sp. 22II-S9-Z10]|nr:flagellar biosynthesis repressor FlbT [Stappia sp. 22II-S9-Z10]
MTASTNRRFPQPDEGRRESPRPMHISLRAGERLFLNGAVLRVDRKVTLELLNDATFLLENHVLQVEDTKTPMRQLYFAVQAMLMDPANAPASRALFEAMAHDVTQIYRSQTLRGGILEAVRQVLADRPFHALKTLRGLFAEETEVLAGLEASRVQNAAAQSSAPVSELPKAPAKAAAPTGGEIPKPIAAGSGTETMDEAAFAAVGQPRRASAGLSH